MILFTQSCALLFPPGILNEFVGGKTLVLEQIDSSQISWKGERNSFGDNHIIYNDKLYFGVEDSGGTYRMIGWDGNTFFQVNTSEAYDYSHGFGEPILYGGYLFFAGITSNSQTKVYLYDGIRVDEVNQDGSYSNDFGSPVVYANTLYFESDGGQISSYNSGPGTIVTLNNPQFSSSFRNSIAFDSKLFFEGSLTNSINQEMLSYHAGSFNTFTNVDYSFGFVDPLVVNDVLVFTGIDSLGIEKLFYYTPIDGVNRAINLSTFSSNVQSGDFAILNNKLYFQGLNTNYTRRLYEFDTITKSINELDDESGYNLISDGVPLYSMNGKLYFSGSSNTSHFGAHVYDGISIKNIPVMSSEFNGGIINPSNLDNILIFLGIVGDVSSTYYFKHFYLDDSGIWDIKIKQGTRYSFSLLSGEGTGIKFKDHILIPGGYVENGITNMAIYKISLQ